MIVGYARTSTVSQVAGLEGRIRDLEVAGCERIFSEQTSAVGPRLILDQALAFVRQNDVFTVTKPDRLARSTADLLNIVDALTKRGIRLRILWMGSRWSSIHPRLRQSLCSPHWQQWRPSSVSLCWRGNAKASGRPLRRGNIVGALRPAEPKSDVIQELRQAGIGPARDRSSSIDIQSISLSDHWSTDGRYNSAVRMSCAKSSGPGALTTCRKRGSLCLLCAHSRRSRAK